MPDKTDKKAKDEPNVPVSDASDSSVADATSNAVADSSAADAVGDVSANDAVGSSQKAADAVADAKDATVDAVADETLNRVVEKVGDADSILVVLSKDPSVDEMAAAIAMTISLDRMGKHATAIYSGKTPNALKFLEPEKTFETNTNSLQDFIIALDKEKADHLRYKIEGDFVKVYITPYRTTISEDDLEFTHGEVNVDMVISFNVPTPEDLDAALAQHGRIMHDAVSINISNKIPGRLGGVEWNDPFASSVSEMVMKFLKAENQEVEKDVATALLTGIIAETERFSNDKTTPETMAASAELMQKGADQQIVASHISELKEPKPEATEEKPKKEQPKPSSIDVSGEDEKSEVSADAEKLAEPEVPAETPAEPVAKTTPVVEVPVEPVMGVAPAVEVSAESTTETAPTAEINPVMGAVPEVAAVPEVKAPEVAIAPEVAMTPETEAPEVAAVPSAAVPVEQVYSTPADTVNMSDGVMSPAEEIEQPKDYGAMMEQELAESLNAPAVNPALNAVPEVAVGPEVAPAAQMAQPMMAPEDATPFGAVAAPVLPATEVATAPVLSTPEAPTLPPPPMPPVAGMPAVPEAPMQPEVPATPITPAMPEVAMQPEQPVQPLQPEQLLQPVQPMAPVQPMPPAEPQDTSSALGIPEAPEGVAPPPEPVNPVVVQPIPDPASVPPVQDPGSFKIPGM